MVFNNIVNLNRRQNIEDNLYQGRVLIVYGPRRVGKTTLLLNYLNKNKDKKSFFATGDDVVVRQLFASEDRKKILDFAKPYEIIAIDEAQNITKIGIGIKMIIDSFPDKKIILTGSSSFELSTEIEEPLTGRHFIITLLPFAQSELDLSNFELENNLEDFLLYGSYPEVLKADDNKLKIKILQELSSSYLFKDILSLDKIKSPELLLDITKSLAFQVGSEVSFNEIANNLKKDVKTVQRYINVLEKMFIVKKVGAYSTNLRKEISKKSKYYFYDNGIRNALIMQFNDLKSRNDIGALWENFIFTELMKLNFINDSSNNFYFWRSGKNQEIDIIIESLDGLSAFECKWSKDKLVVPNFFQKKYPEVNVNLINKYNYLDYFIS